MKLSFAIKSLRLAIAAGFPHLSSQQAGRIDNGKVSGGTLVLTYRGLPPVLELAERCAADKGTTAGARKVQRRCGTDLYKVRNTVERCVNRLRQFKRIAMRYDRRAANFLGFLQLAAAMIWMR